MGISTGNTRMLVSYQHILDLAVAGQVIDWTLPDSREYKSYFGLWQSPESLAVPMRAAATLSYVTTSIGAFSPGPGM